MKKKLVIHIGTPKTGTTSIQNTFGASRDILLENNIYYPSMTQYNHIFNFMPIFKENADKLVFLQRDEMDAQQFKQRFKHYEMQWLEEFKNFKQGTFIISAEWLTIFNREEVQKVKEFVTPYFDEIQIVVYVRPFSSFISSIVQQMVKEGWFSVQAISSFTEGPISPITYIKSIRQWINTFSEELVSVRLFDKKAFIHEDLLADFLTIIGHSSVDIKKLRQNNTNESLTNDTVLVLSKLNELYPLVKDGELNEQRGLANRLLPRNIYYKMKGDKFKLDVQYSEQDAVLLNNEVDYINQFLEPAHQLVHVVPSNKKTYVDDVENVSATYYAELLNDYHREIGKHFRNQDFYEGLLNLAGTNKKVYIWGAGSAGTKVLELAIKARVGISGFIDSNEQKSGTSFHDLAVYTPQELFSKYEKEELFILIGSTYFEEIIAQLKLQGLKEKEHFLAKAIYTVK